LSLLPVRTALQAGLVVVATVATHLVLTEALEAMDLALKMRPMLVRVAVLISAAAPPPGWTAMFPITVGVTSGTLGKSFEFIRGAY
jgi:hypothetical protein